MDSLKQYVHDATAAGLDTETIRQALVEQGWSEKDIVAAFPAPKKTTKNTVAHTDVKSALEQSSATPETERPRPSLSPLVAALHHVFLWCFTSIATFSIFMTIALIANENSGDPRATIVVGIITILTVAVYLGFYIPYLIKAVKSPFLTAQKVWSIITICIHGVSALGFLIAIIPQAVYGAPGWVLLSTILVLLLNLAVVGTYLAASFFPPQGNTRPVLLWLLMPLLILVIIGLSITAILVSAVRGDTTNYYENSRSYDRYDGYDFDRNYY